jgi:phosphate transport system permease protein
MNYSDRTQLTKPIAFRRNFTNKILTVIAILLTILGILPLVSLLWEIISKGFPGLTGAILTKSIVDEGFANAIIGTVSIVAIASLISIPIGIGVGIYLSEYDSSSKINRSAKFSITILTGVPSIVVGIFTYDAIVLTSKALLDKSYSAIAGAIALAIIMLPIIALTTEEVLKLVPDKFRQAAAGLGATKFQTISKIIVPAALPAIATGVLLAISRAAGETAPLLFTALFAQDWADGLLEPTASLPVLIFNLYNDPDPVKNQLVWTASLLLLAIVLVINLPSRLFASKGRSTRG